MNEFNLFFATLIAIGVFLLGMFFGKNNNDNINIKDRKEEIKDELEKKSPADIIDDHLPDDTKDDIERIKKGKRNRLFDFFDKIRNRK
jgi:hypothetical protein